MYPHQVRCVIEFGTRVLAQRVEVDSIQCPWDDVEYDGGGLDDTVPLREFIDQ